MNMKSDKSDLMMSAPDHKVPSLLVNDDDKNASLSKDMSDSSNLDMHSDSPMDESEIFSLKQHQNYSHIEFSLPSVSDSACN